MREAGHGARIFVHSQMDVMRIRAFIPTVRRKDSMRMRGILRAIPVVALSLGLGTLVACGGGEDTQGVVGAAEESPLVPQVTSPETAPSAPAPDVEKPAGTVVAITNEDIGGSGAYRFNPSELTFKKGQTVTLRLKAETEFHTFTVDELGIDEALGAGESKDFIFTFDTPGVFDLICIVHPDMTGAITVE